MSLAVLKAQNEVKEKEFLACEQKVEKVLGKKVPVIVHWDGFNNEKLVYNSKFLLEKISNGIEKVCSDPASKDYVASKLNQIEVFGEDSNNEFKIEVADQNLRITMSNTYADEDKIKAFLNNKL
jgi:hypothetical protein